MSDNTHTVFLALGSNLGDKTRMLSLALEQIATHGGKIIKTSSIYETSPWGFNHEESFYNLVTKIETTLTPSELLHQLLQIETQLGRIRNSSEGYAARTIDIDILFFDNIILTENSLTIPHPHIEKRLFVLVPLNEIAPEFVHPISQKTIQTILTNCEDKGEVKRVE